ncbi:Dachshund-like protein 1 [Dirofilaria immitis]|nr:Dachshund-like protein 1 [Dirofilaria immitis]
MYPIMEQLQRQRSISVDSIPFPNSIHGSIDEQQSLDNIVNSHGSVQEDMIRPQQMIMTSQLPTLLSYNDNKSVKSINNARIYTYRGEKIAGFELQGIRMICLPQAYETFLKNVISGLHTVHSKLKRLQIQLVICNVEQVRALRSLGAIQQGVNRCKLISCNDFDQLYDDCYKIRHRSGRPAKHSVKWENATCKKVNNRNTIQTVQDADDDDDDDDDEQSMIHR